MTASYGYCPRCGAPGVQRERRINGYDTCENGHEYLSRLSLPSPPAIKSTNIDRASLGKCPFCNQDVYLREKRPDGNDECEKGHRYPSRLTQPARPVTSKTGWREGGWLPREYHTPNGVIHGPLQPVFLSDPPSAHEYVWLAVYFDAITPENGYGPYDHPLRSGDAIQLLHLLSDTPSAPAGFRWRWLPLQVPALD